MTKTKKRYIYYTIENVKKKVTVIYASFMTDQFTSLPITYLCVCMSTVGIYDISRLWGCKVISVINGGGKTQSFHLKSVGRVPAFENEIVLHIVLSRALALTAQTLTTSPSTPLTYTRINVVVAASAPTSCES